MTAQPRHITILVTEKVDKRLTEMAKGADQKKADLASTLFLAAYAARCGGSGDEELEARVNTAVEAQGSAAPDAEMELARARVAELERMVAEQKRAIAELTREVTDLRNTSHRRKELEQELREERATAAGVRQAHTNVLAERDRLRDDVERGSRTLQGLMAELEEARCAPPPLRLDDLVLAIIMAAGAGLTPATIAERCGLREFKVEHTLDLWRAELAMRAEKVAA